MSWVSFSAKRTGFWPRDLRYMALGRGRLPGPGCDRPLLAPPPPERITSWSPFFNRAVHDDGKDLAGNTDNGKTAPTTPRTNQPEAPNGPQAPKCHRGSSADVVNGHHQVSGSAWSSSWGHALGRQQRRCQGGPSLQIRPSLVRVCVPEPPSTPSGHGETKRCLDIGGVAAVWTAEMDSIVALPVPSPQPSLNLPSWRGLWRC